MPSEASFFCTLPQKTIYICRSPISEVTIVTLPFHPIQSSSVAQSCLTLCNPMNRRTPGSLSITNSQSLLKHMPIELVMPSIHLILCSPLLLPAVPSRITVYSNEPTLHKRWPKYWQFSFSIMTQSSILLHQIVSYKNGIYHIQRISL